MVFNEWFIEKSPAEIKILNIFLFFESTQTLFKLFELHVELPIRKNKKKKEKKEKKKVEYTL